MKCTSTQTKQHNNFELYKISHFLKENKNTIISTLAAATIGGIAYYLGRQNGLASTPSLQTCPSIVDQINIPSDICISQNSSEAQTSFLLSACQSQTNQLEIIINKKNNEIARLLTVSNKLTEAAHKSADEFQQICQLNYQLTNDLKNVDKIATKVKPLLIVAIAGLSWVVFKLNDLQKQLLYC
jgi:hypothetical protein